MSGYPIILGGDHAAFEQEWAASGRPAHERPDWPLPSFDARDWAAEFCRIANGFGFKDQDGKPIDEGWMIGWYANALMRGYDERASQEANARIPAYPTWPSLGRLRSAWLVLIGRADAIVWPHDARMKD